MIPEILLEIIQQADDWDIILLYAQGITNYKNNTWKTHIGMGSAGIFNKLQGFIEIW